MYGKQCKPRSCCNWQHLIWVYTLCKGLSVPILRVITVGHKLRNSVFFFVSHAFGTLSNFLVPQFSSTQYVPASVAQLDAPSDWRPGGCGFNTRRGRLHSFLEIDHEIFSMVILSLPLIQEGQLSVSGKRMCTILVNRFED